MGEIAKVPSPVLGYVAECARRLREDPADPHGLFARALIFAALGRATEARESLLRLARVAPGHPAVERIQAGESAILEFEAMPTSVLTYVDECARRLEKNPLDPDALFARAAILATLGQYQDALESLTTLAKVAPRYPAVWRLKARLYKDIGDERTAELCIRAAERFDEEHEQATAPRPSPRAKEADLIRRLILNEGR